MTLNSIEEKEKRVMKMLQEGKNFQEIAKEEHISFTFISMVKKKMLGEDPSINKRLSIPTQALKMFSGGKSVLEVTIELDRPVEEIRGYYEDYLDLKKMSDLVLLVEFHYHNIPIIKRMIRFILSNPVSQNDLIIALSLVKDINRLKNIKKNLEEKIETLHKTRNQRLDGGRVINQF